MFRIGWVRAVGWFTSPPTPRSWMLPIGLGSRSSTLAEVKTVLMSLAAFHPAQFRLPGKYLNQFSADMRANAGPPRDCRSFTAGEVRFPSAGKTDPAPRSPADAHNPRLTTSYFKEKTMNKKLLG